jgi:opacity protein-like surface antigen
MKKIALASVLAAAAIGVQAQTYGEIGYTSTTFKETVDGFTVKASPSAIRAILGYELNPNLAVEGMAAIGMGGASIKVNDVSIPDLKLKVENAVGVYLKPKMKLNDAVEVFGRLGYASVKGTLYATGLGSDSGTDNSFSYGAGLSYAIDPKTSLNGDYMQYLSKDGAKVNGFTFGVGYKF